MTPALAHKAHRLLDQRRVLIVLGDPGVAMVCGDHDLYTVTATWTGVRCNCTAGQVPQECSHRLAALVAWAELASRRSTHVHQPPPPTLMEEGAGQQWPSPTSSTKTLRPSSWRT